MVSLGHRSQLSTVLPGTVQRYPVQHCQETAASRAVKCVWFRSQWRPVALWRCGATAPLHKRKEGKSECPGSAVSHGRIPHAKLNSKATVMQSATQ